MMCTSVAPIDKRGPLLALLAFNLEIATIPEIVSEPLLGEIRLQWWRDTLDAIFDSREIEHPVALGLKSAVEQHCLSKNLFDEYFEARSFDLNGQPPASLEELENYADASAGALNELMAEVLLANLAAESRNAVRHAGVSWALSGLLKAISFHSAQGRSYMPRGVNEDRRIQAVAEAALVSIRKARSLSSKIPPSLLPVMLPVTLADHWLKQLAQSGYDPNDPRFLRPGIGRLFGFYWNMVCKKY